MQIKTGGHLLLFCMSDANEDPYTGPERISKTQLKALFSVQTPKTHLALLLADTWQKTNASCE